MKIHFPRVILLLGLSFVGCSRNDTTSPDLRPKNQITESKVISTVPENTNVATYGPKPGQQNNQVSNSAAPATPTGSPTGQSPAVRPP